VDIPIKHPPLEKRIQILSQYKEALSIIGYPDADFKYRIAMRDLYEYYNPHLKHLRKAAEKKKRNSDY